MMGEPRWSSSSSSFANHCFSDITYWKNENRKLMGVMKVWRKGEEIDVILILKHLQLISKNKRVFV